MARQDPATMDDDSIAMEIDSLESHMEDCARMECGVSTKDSVRLRRLRAERMDRRLP